MAFLTALLKYADDTTQILHPSTDIGQNMTQLNIDLAPASFLISLRKTVIMCKEETMLIHCPQEVQIKHTAQKVVGHKFKYIGLATLEQFGDLSSKCSKKIGVASKVGFFYNGLFSSTKLDIMFTLLYPVLDTMKAYAPSEAIAKELEKLRMKMLRIATDCTKLVPECLIKELLNQGDLLIRMLYMHHRGTYTTQTKFLLQFPDPIPYVQKEKIFARLPD